MKKRHEGGYTTKDEVVVRKDFDKETRRFMLKHELGHVIYGDEEMGLQSGVNPRLTYQAASLTEELIADYYALKIDSDDGLAREDILWHKNYAVSQGEAPSIVEFKERVAIQKVGYTGRPVGWTE